MPVLDLTLIPVRTLIVTFTLTLIQASILPSVFMPDNISALNLIFPPVLKSMLTQIKD